MSRSTGRPAARTCALQALLWCLALLLVPTASADQWPVLSRVVTVNNRALGHTSPNAQYQTRPMARVGQHVYFLYRRSDDAQDGSVYGRKLDLANVSNSGWVGPTQRVLDGYADPAEVHRHPSFMRDARGQLVALWNWAYLDELPRFADGSTIRSAVDPQRPARFPRFGVSMRLITDFDAPSSWGGQSEIPSRIQNDFGWERCPKGLGAEWSLCGAGMWDITGAYDEQAGCSYFVGELYNHQLRYDGTFDGAPARGGLPRGFYRVCGDASQRAAFDGPYMVVRSDFYPSIPLGDPPRTTWGNVFTKGDVKLGRVHDGRRTVHLVWHKHLTMVIENGSDAPDTTCGQPGNDDDHVQWDWDVMYARSEDGGRTWCNHAGSRCVAKTIEWNDNTFRIWRGEVDETAPYSWAVDANDNPVLLLATWDGYAGNFKGRSSDSARWHLDWNTCPFEPVPGKVLQLVRYDTDAGRFTNRAVDTWDQDQVPRVCIRGCGRTSVVAAPRGDIYLFREDPPRYAKTTDGGATWSDWVRFDDPSQHDPAHRDDAWRVVVMDDPLDPNLVHLLYQSRSERVDANGNGTGNLYHYLNFRVGEGDSDADGIDDASDNCPTVANGPAQVGVAFVGNQSDRDLDRIGDACDNCVAMSNPALPRLPFQTTTGGQLDDDADGRGNACDADFDNRGGRVPDSADFALFKYAFGQPRSGGGCGALGTQLCDVYDLVDAGTGIDSQDLTRFRSLFGRVRRGCPTCGPPWPNAALPCEGDACP